MKISRCIDLHLAIKIQFLVAKRAALLTRDLHNIVSFGIPSHGTVALEREPFRLLLSLPQLAFTLSKLRLGVNEKEARAKHDWQEACEMLFHAFRHMEGFTLDGIGQVYSEELALTKGLVAASNACALQLFLAMVAPILALVDKEGFRKLKKSRVVMELDYGPVLAHDLLVLLRFERAIRRGGENIWDYENEIRRMEAAELFNRLKIAYESFT